MNVARRSGMAVLAAALLTASPARTEVVRVQETDATTPAGATSLTLAWPAPTQGGNLLVLAAHVLWNDTVGTIGVPAGWQLARRADRVDGFRNVSVALYYREGAPAQSGDVTVTALDPEDRIKIVLAEYRGARASGSLDQTAGASGLSAMPVSGTTAVTTSPAELWVSALANAAGLSQCDPTGGFVAVGSTSSGASTLGLYERLVSTAGTASTSVRLSSAFSCDSSDSYSLEWAGVVATFRADTAPPPSACADADGDGEADDTDACPSTPAGEPVDGDGCSLAQFCDRFDVRDRVGLQACLHADWRNDEPVMRARDRDCRVLRDATGTPVRCGPATGVVPPSTTWTAKPFTSASTVQTPCQGARYVRFLPAYAKWVGVALCSPTRYKLFLADGPDDTFREIGDYAGHGQDHCELVNPGFSIPDEDDITSGGCTHCSLDGAHVFDPPVGSQGWSRARFGEPFRFEPSWPEFNLYTAQWYECGIAIP